MGVGRYAPERPQAPRSISDIRAGVVGSPDGPTSAPGFIPPGWDFPAWSPGSRNPGIQAGVQVFPARKAQGYHHNHHLPHPAAGEAGLPCLTLRRARQVS